MSTSISLDVGKIKGDYCKYLAEFKSSNDKKEVADQSLRSYQVAYYPQQKLIYLLPTICLGLALNFSVFYYENMNSRKRSCHLEKQAFDEAISELNSLSDESYKDSTYIYAASEFTKGCLDIWVNDNYLNQLTEELGILYYTQIGHFCSQTCCCSDLVPVLDLFFFALLLAITSLGAKKGEVLLADVNTKLINKNFTTDVKADTNSKKISAKNKKNRSFNKVPPAVGSLSVARRVYMKKKKGKEVTAIGMYEIAHYSKKTHKMVNEEAEKVLNGLRTEEANSTLTPAEICLKQLKHIPGHIKGRSASTRNILGNEKLRLDLESEKERSQALEENMRVMNKKQRRLQKQNKKIKGQLKFMMREIKRLSKVQSQTNYSENQLTCYSGTGIVFLNNKSIKTHMDQLGQLKNRKS
ncbi:14-3-3 domain-containing protein [Tanacetum coccineum]